MLRFLLGILICINSIWSQAVIEYGGIAFECEESNCAFPGEDATAKTIVNIYDKAVRDTSNEAGFLCDDMHKWRGFTPHRSSADTYFPFIEMERYNWEDEGITDISGEYHSWERVFYPDGIYFVRESYPINQSGLIEVFNRLSADLEYYQDQRFNYYQRRMETCHRKISLYRSYQTLGFTHLTLDEGRVGDPVRQSDFSEDEWEEDLYSDLTNEIYYQEKLAASFSEKSEEASKQCRVSLKWLDSAYAEIDPLLRKIFIWCLENHQPEGIAFTGAVESLLSGDFPEALEYIRILLAVGEKTGFSSEQMHKLHLLKGQLQAEFCLHGDAIVSLTEAIGKNPSSQEAYLERAAAYFEMGKFDLAIADFRMQESMMSLGASDFSELARGFVLGVASGFGEVVSHFIPNTLSSVQGMSHFLWATLQHPIETPRAIIASAFEIFSVLRQSSSSELAELAIPELAYLRGEWDKMSDFSRFEQIGHILGKYGTEILSPLALRKGSAFVMHLQDLKQANKLATLKSLSDVEKKGAILEASAQVAQNRQTQLAKIKIEWDKQNKHVPGAHNFDPVKSRFTHGDPQALLEQFAGKGKRRGQIEQGPGYKEKVNFGVIIGEVQGKDNSFVPTSWGMIHYSKTGAHIVPHLPDEF